MFVYTAMNPNGTGLMMLLGLPFVAVSLFVGLAFQESFSGAYIVALIASPFLWSFAYTRALRWFNTLRPAKPTWQFLSGVFALDLILVGGTIYAVA